jgi:hypothetical protein
MRLINVRTLALEEFFGDQIPPYAILSHTWGPNHEEVQFKDIESGCANRKPGYRKIEYLCKQAAKDILYWAWCDTCCIDKSSSAELSESINSMYQWYQGAEICYAYLSDVLTTDADPEYKRDIQQSRWFTRGWTLQELLAPETVYFYNRDWNFLGDKDSFQDEIWDITGVNFGAMNYPWSLPSYSIATRMSWASRRTTTRIEDQAYCMLGILGVHMPLLYGEGHNAFRRLQEELIKISDDETIFAHSGREVLAQGPQQFASGSDLTITRKCTSAPYSMTNSGVQIHMRVLMLNAEVGNIDNEEVSALGILNCYHNNATNRNKYIALPLATTRMHSTYRKASAPLQLVDAARATAAEYQTIFIQLQAVRISRITLFEDYDPAQYVSVVHPHGSCCVYNEMERAIRLYPKPMSEYVAVLHAFERVGQTVDRHFGIVTFFDLVNDRAGVLLLRDYSYDGKNSLDVTATYKIWISQGRPSCNEISNSSFEEASKANIRVEVLERGPMNPYFWFLRVGDGCKLPDPTSPNSTSPGYIKLSGEP